MFALIAFVLPGALTVGSRSRLVVSPTPNAILHNSNLRLRGVFVFVLLLCLLLRIVLSSRSSRASGASSTCTSGATSGLKPWQVSRGLTHTITHVEHRQPSSTGGAIKTTILLRSRLGVVDPYTWHRLQQTKAGYPTGRIKMFFGTCIQTLRVVCFMAGILGFVCQK